MMFRLALISAALFGSVASMKANSALGRKLLSKARRVEEGEVDYSWIMNYSIKFAQCHTVTQYGGGEEGGEEGNGIWKQRSVKFKLCPTDECGYGCEGGDYLVDMASFVDLYTEAKMTQQELNCETTRENCYCDDVDDEDYCEAQCYKAAGQDYCIEVEDEDQAVFDVQEYLECVEIEDQNGDGYYGKNYYVGLSCSESGERINMKVYADATCSEEGPSQVFSKYFGYSLPYAEESIVAQDCVSCIDNGDGDDAGELSELCGTSYEAAAKCENDLDRNGKVTNGCDYIQNIYLREDNYIPRTSPLPLIFAWVFFISTIVLAVIAGKIYQMKSTRIELNSASGAVV